VYHEHLQIIDTIRARLDATMKRVQMLEKENAELKAKITVLHRRQFKVNTKKTQHEAPSDTTGAKKRGAPVGHPGWCRARPEHIDWTIAVPAPRRCPRCGSEDLSPLPETTEHLQEDIVMVNRPRVTRYLHGGAYCPRCRRAVFKTAEDEILHAPVGPVGKSVATYLRYGIGISYRKVHEILKDLFGLDCVPASLVGFDRRAAENASALYDDLKEKIRASRVVHADETSWRNDGTGHFVWYAGNNELAYFHIHRNRSAEVAKGIFGKDFTGIIVRDRYAAYNGIALWQSCLAHIITRARELIREHALLPDNDKDRVEPFLRRIIDLGSRACEVGRKLQSGEIPWKKSALIEKQFVRELRNICACPLAFKPAETFRTYLGSKESQYLFTFLRYPGVPPTNNQAEQSLRHMVIFRKLCFGTRSVHGLRTHSVLPSLIQTAKRQGVHPRAFLQILLTADTATAQAALYHNSS
jgi:hypothetical protein